MTTEEMVVDVSQDWVLACDVQQGFMQTPRTVSDTLDYSACCRQIQALGGDCYNFIPLKRDQLALVVGDASGKGLAAALMIANVQSSLRTAALFTGNDLAALLKVVNHQAYHSSLEDHFATLFYGVFDGVTRTLRYANAGHNPPMVLRRDGTVEWLAAGGAPVGMFPDSRYEESIVQLDPGDVVIAYTDGVIDAASPAGEEWGLRGLLSMTSACETRNSRRAEEIVELVFNAMDDFSKGYQTDDATLAVLRVA